MGWWAYTHAHRRRILFAKRQIGICNLCVVCVNTQGDLQHFKSWSVGSPFTCPLILLMYPTHTGLRAEYTLEEKPLIRVWISLFGLWKFVKFIKPIICYCVLLDFRKGSLCLWISKALSILYWVAKCYQAYVSSHMVHNPYVSVKIESDSPQHERSSDQLSHLSASGQILCLVLKYKSNIKNKYRPSNISIFII